MNTNGQYNCQTKKRSKRAAHNAVIEDARLLDVFDARLASMAYIIRVFHYVVA